MSALQRRPLFLPKRHTTTGMSTSKGHNDTPNVKYRGDGLPQEADLSTSSRNSSTSARTRPTAPPPSSQVSEPHPEQGGGRGTRTSHRRGATHSGSRWRMPSKARPVTPKPFKDSRIRREFEAVKERMEDRWNADADKVDRFIRACQSPIERQFVIDLVEEAGGRLERAHTAAERPDGWSLTISSPFRLQRRLHTSPWLEVYPQRPILTPESDEKAYRQVDFFFEVCCDEAPAGINGRSCLRRFFVETEGEKYHSNPRERGRDHDRARKLRRIGVEPIRFTGSQVNSSEHHTAEEALRFAWDVGTKPIESGD